MQQLDLPLPSSINLSLPISLSLFVHQYNRIVSTSYCLHTRLIRFPVLISIA